MSLVIGSSGLRSEFEWQKTELSNAIMQRDVVKIEDVKNNLGDILNKFSVDMFLSKIFKREELHEIRKEIEQEIFRAKFALKLDHVNFSYADIMDQFDHSIHGTSEGDLSHVLINEHVFERMVKFGHAFDGNHEPRFRFTDIDTGLVTFFKALGLQEIDGQAQFLCDRKGQGLVLRIPGKFQDGRHQLVSVDDVSLEELKQVITQNDLSKIQIIWPTQLLTIQGLIDQEVLERDVETGALIVSPNYQYLECGFVKQLSLGWKYLEPHRILETPPATFMMDILVHLPRGGGMMDQGHASVQLTTPSGEVYSVGFYPLGSEAQVYQSVFDQLKTFEIKKATLESPDHYIFLPTTACDTKRISFSIDDPKSFHTIFDFIESTHVRSETDGTGVVYCCNAFYQSTHHNCAAFADAIARLAVDLGAKRVEDSGISPFESKKIAMQGVFFESIFQLPIIKRHSNASDALKQEGFEGLTRADLTHAPSLMPAGLLNKYTDLPKPKEKLSASPVAQPEKKNLSKRSTSVVETDSLETRLGMLSDVAWPSMI
jgi:hypothetical protein